MGHGSAGAARIQWAVLAAPAVFVVVVILDAYAASSSHWSEVLRTLLVVIVCAMVLTAVARLITRNDVLASGLASAVVLLLLTPVNAPLVVACAGIAALIGLWRSKGGEDAQRPIGNALLFLPGALLVIVLVRIVATGAVTAADFATVPALPEPPTADLENVYVLLLDGYPREDSLADFGFDNGPFLEELRDLGFEVHDDARSRYPRTELAITSMLSPRAPPGLAELVIPPRRDFVAARRLVRRELLPRVPGPADLTTAGYRLVYSGPPLRHVTPLGWHENRTATLIESFEVAVLQRSALAPLAAGWVADQHREWMARTLEAWTRSVPTGQPQFVFAHLLAPHAPYVVADGGRGAGLPECWLSGCSIYAAREWHLSPEELAPLLTANVAALNDRLLPVLESLIREDPAATVILFSDHGAAIESIDAPERNTTLFAARTPDRPSLFDGRAGPDALVYTLLGDD